MLLVDIAVGDAYGAGFEFKDDELIRAYNTGFAFLPHALSAKGPGCYTDDTQMSIAIAEVVLANRESPSDLRPIDFAQAFGFCFLVELSQKLAIPPCGWTPFRESLI